MFLGLVKMSVYVRKLPKICSRRDLSVDVEAHLEHDCPALHAVTHHLRGSHRVFRDRNNVIALVSVSVLWFKD